MMICGCLIFYFIFIKKKNSVFINFSWWEFFFVHRKYRKYSHKYHHIITVILMDNLDNLEEKCASARKSFLELSRKEPDDGSTESSSTFPEEIVILTDVPNERYRKFREEERKVNLFIRLVKGKLIA